jgi:hypothetical protein
LEGDMGEGRVATSLPDQLLSPFGTTLAALGGMHSLQQWGVIGGVLGIQI